MAGTQIPTLKLLPLPLLWSWVSLEFLMTWMGISDHIEYILYWINWLWLQSHWIQCKRASKTGNFLPKVKMFIIWETLNFTWCFVHQTNSNCLNFHGIEWSYDWSRNKQVIQDQSCHSNCETPCITKQVVTLGQWVASLAKQYYPTHNLGQPNPFLRGHKTPLYTNYQSYKGALRTCTGAGLKAKISFLAPLV